jgi:hypothetical protein
VVVVLLAVLVGGNFGVVPLQLDPTIASAPTTTTAVGLFISLSPVATYPSTTRTTVENIQSAPNLAHTHDAFDNALSFRDNGLFCSTRIRCLAWRRRDVTAHRLADRCLNTDTTAITMMTKQCK